MLLSQCLQQIGLLIASFLNALLSAACCTGLILAISVTVAHNGQGLMLGCNDTQVPINARSPVSVRCPFDTTRIYVSLTSYISPSLKCSFSTFLPQFALCLTIQAATFDAWNFIKASHVQPRNLTLFHTFLPRSHHFLSLRTPPWRCGSLVLYWQRLRLDCLSGASLLDWLSEGWPPVGTATSKSRCVCVCLCVGVGGHAWGV